jgi:type II secretory pathway pseudopilin PulG
MTGEQTEALIGMAATLALLVLMILPSLVGIVRERRIDRQLREAEQAREGERTLSEAQKSSSRSTVPSTATWYAEGRRSKKLVSS